MASGKIVPMQSYFYRQRDNSQTYTIGLETYNSANFRSGLLIQNEKNNPGMWLIGTDTGTSPSVKAYKIGLTGSSSPADISSITLAEGTLTITFNRQVYGGITVVWFD